VEAVAVAATTEKAGFIASGFMAVFVVAAFGGEADRGEGVGATLTGGARAIHILILIGVTAAVITAAVFTQAAMGGALTGNSRIGRGQLVTCCLICAAAAISRIRCNSPTSCRVRN
jgi:hypothetical protein